MVKRKEVTPGERFGRLVCTGGRRYLPEKGRTFVECQCDCGATNWHELKSIREGKIKSCGCARKERFLKEVKRIGANSPQWKGHGEIARNIWQSYVDSASKRNIPFELSIEDGWDLFLKQDRKCALSGVPLGFAASQKKYTTRTASLDRIDSSLGYTLSNVQWVHKDLNFMKRSLSQDELLKWCELILSHQKRVRV